jgi:hypothetical protein
MTAVTADGGEAVGRPVVTGVDGVHTGTMSKTRKGTRMVGAQMYMPMHPLRKAYDFILLLACILVLLMNLLSKPRK